MCAPAGVTDINGGVGGTREHPHLGYGYAVTSHSSQGATADRVLVHVDTEQAHEQLVNSRLAYVSASRARYDAQIYTNDAEKLGQELSRDVSRKGHGQNGVDGVYGLFFCFGCSEAAGV